jgi:hypothetical protein
MSDKNLQNRPKAVDPKIIKLREAYDKKLNEGYYNLSTTGKIFFAAVAAYLTGKIASGAFLKLRGKPEELRAVADAIVASKAFQDELRKPGATIDSVIEKMNLKNMTTARFERISGQKWPL